MMTEHEWDSCEDPHRMLNVLDGRVSERKLRLFATGCCRLIWGVLADQGSWATVEAAERYADGRIPLAELSARAAEAWTDVVRLTAQGDAWQAAREIAPLARAWAPRPDDYHTQDWQEVYDAEGRKQAGLLRELIGPLLFRAVAIDPVWLARDDGAAARLATAIYEEQAFDDLPILADALEEAGCDDAEILGHCRGPGPHFRGCWVLDLLSARE